MGNSRIYEKTRAEALTQRQAQENLQETNQDELRDQAMYSAKQAGRNCAFVWRV